MLKSDLIWQQQLVYMYCYFYCPFINYVPETGQRLYCCLQWKLNIDKAPAFTPDFIVLTNMFCLQNNLNLIIYQRGERPLSFNMSPVRAPDVRDHVLVLTIHAKSVPGFIHYWKQILQGGFRHGHRDWYITCIEVTWDCLSRRNRDRITKTYLHPYSVWSVLCDQYVTLTLQKQLLHWKGIMPNVLN